MVDKEILQTQYTEHPYYYEGAIANPKDSIKIWLPSANAIYDIAGGDSIESISLNSSQMLLATVSGNTAHLYTLRNVQNFTVQTAVLHIFAEEAWDVSFSTDQKFLAAAGDETVIIYKIGG